MQKSCFDSVAAIDIIFHQFMIARHYVCFCLFNISCLLDHLSCFSGYRSQSKALCLLLSFSRSTKCLNETIDVFVSLTCIQGACFSSFPRFFDFLLTIFPSFLRFTNELVMIIRSCWKGKYQEWGNYWVLYCCDRSLSWTLCCSLPAIASKVSCLSPCFICNT